MKIKIQEIFPTIFYEFKFSQEQILPLCEEISAKKIEIKKRYEDSDFEDIRIVDYWTDYYNPVNLLEYKKIVVEEILPLFLPELRCEHLQNWTAIYEETGYHGTHNHTHQLYDIPNINMSSILYLSDIGETEFFNPRQADVTHQAYRVSSQVGKMIMFPAHILHGALPHGKKGDYSKTSSEGRPEKIIVSSNWRLYKNPTESTKK